MNQELKKEKQMGKAFMDLIVEVVMEALQTFGNDVVELDILPGIEKRIFGNTTEGKSED